MDARWLPGGHLDLSSVFNTFLHDFIKHAQYANLGTIGSAHAVKDCLADILNFAKYCCSCLENSCRILIKLSQRVDIGTIFFLLSYDLV